MENSNIEWTDHTFNPWWGCVKVSPGCKHCYAETLDNRYHKENPHWGPGSSRKGQTKKYWDQIFKWDDTAKKEGVIRKVFVASMADIFEDHPDVGLWRSLFLDMVSACTNLIFQLLTKRPENIMGMIPFHWMEKWPDNVWIGTTVENQQQAEIRIPYLIRIPASVLFLSCEPMLSEIKLPVDWADGSGMVNWVICGGESGHGARPMNDRWAQSLRDQCKQANVAFFFKQWGEHIPISQVRYLPKETRETLKTNHGHPGDMPDTFKLGKKANGSLLDGVEHKNFPNGLH